MKQQGKTWTTAEGEETLAKYLPQHVKLFEKVGQRIAAEATALECSLRQTKAAILDLCKEALRNNPDQGVRRRFTFHTFDREYKIEFDVKEEYVRVYRATKSNPSSKDYELINLDFNRSELVFPLATGPVPETEDSSEEERNSMAVGIDLERQLPEEVYQHNMNGIDQERSGAYTENRPAPEQEVQMSFDKFCETGKAETE